MSNQRPYDDSFDLGPVPGGDVLFEPPGHTGHESQPAEHSAGPPASAAERARSSPPGQVPPEYRQHDYSPPPRERPDIRPASWGASQVNIPPVAGPDPRTQPVEAMDDNERLTRWNPSPGSKKKMPSLLVLIGGLFILGQVVGGVRGFFDDDSASDPPSVSQQAEQRVIDGMTLEPWPALGTRTSIFFRVRGPVDEERTYTIRFNDDVVRQVTATGLLVTSEPYAPGRWTLTYTGAGTEPCLVSVDSLTVAKLKDPPPTEATCALDTSWLPAEVPGPSASD